jgi:hypothetical protein
MDSDLRTYSTKLVYSPLTEELNHDLFSQEACPQNTCKGKNTIKKSSIQTWMFTKEKSIRYARNSILMIASNSSSMSSKFRTSKITVFSSINQENISEYKKLNKFEYDLKDHVKSPIDNIFRIWKAYPLRKMNCDIYLIVTE